jgi:hypothetical protein
VKPDTALARAARSVNTNGTRTRQKGLEPEVLGRSKPKDPAREQARQLARDRGLKPMHPSPMERLRKPDGFKDDLDSIDDRGSEHNRTDQSSAPQSKRSPSRSSRSMKSRQSEPRASRNGSKRNPKSARKSKPPYVLMAAAAVCVVLGLIMLSRVFGGVSGRPVDVHVPTVDKTQNSTIPRNISAGQSPSNGSRIITTTAQVRQEPAMNLSRPQDIQLSQIAGFSAGIPPVIQFRDGSRLNADPVTLEQVPAEVRMQLTYARGRP